MSFILDALKKSESERQRQAGPTLLEARIVRPSRRPPLWAVSVGLLLLINMAIVAWFLTRPGKAPAGTDTTPDKAAALTLPVTTINTAPAINAPAISAPAIGTPAAGVSADTAGASLPAAAPAAAPAANEAIATNPADLEPATAPLPGAAPSPRSSGLRSYAELSSTLPELRLDLHVYATSPPDRYAFINMHKVHEGDVTPEGIRVVQITREGVVLDYRGAEFLLGRE